MWNWMNREKGPGVKTRIRKPNDSPSVVKKRIADSMQEALNMQEEANRISEWKTKFEEIKKLFTFFWVKMEYLREWINWTLDTEFKTLNDVIAALENWWDFWKHVMSWVNEFYKYIKRLEEHYLRLKKDIEAMRERLHEKGVDIVVNSFDDLTQWIQSSYKTVTWKEITKCREKQSLDVVLACQEETLLAIQEGLEAVPA